MTDIEWLKEHGFKRDTRCKEAKAGDNPPEVWKLNFNLDALRGGTHLEQRRYCCTVLKHGDGCWQAGLSKYNEYIHQAQCPQECTRRAFEEFITCLGNKIIEFVEEKNSATKVMQQLLNSTEE